MNHANCIILGAGMAGMAAADALVQAGAQPVIYEAKPYWGGHTHSVTLEGFTFDEGPHISFTKNAEVQALFARGAPSPCLIASNCGNTYRGQWIRHPVQCNLHGLDPALITQCIVDFVKGSQQTQTIENYGDWCRQMFGKTLAETFPLAYTRKYWTVDAESMNTEWIGQRIYRPQLVDMVRGALGEQRNEQHLYLSQSRYPETGGFQSFMRAMHHPDALRLEHQVTEVDVQTRQLSFANGTRVAYDQLISTMPLPELVRAIKPEQVPAGVREAVDQLLCTSVVLIDLAVARSDLSHYHWFYVYDENLACTRVHFPHMLSQHNAPANCGSIQVEVYYSHHRPLECATDVLVDRVIDELIGLNILANRDEVLWTRTRDLKYANIAYTHERTRALSHIVPWIASHGIELAGRYAEWAYYWTDDAVLSGWRAAKTVMSKASQAV